jgi:hypothetical protein
MQKSAPTGASRQQALAKALSPVQEPEKQQFQAAPLNSSIHSDGSLSPIRSLAKIIHAALYNQQTMPPKSP